MATALFKIDTLSLEGDRLPDTCPICHRAINPRLRHVHLKGEPSGHDASSKIEAVFLCPSSDCNSLFISYYWETSHRAYGSGEYQYRRSAPITPVPPTVFPGIRTISPSFVEIYKQSCEAESRSLDQIAGVGYRKALEFLIKDYCCSLNPDRKDVIKAAFLGNCIRDFVVDQNIKDCANLATWLGNDETHYVRKWETKDIQDLKVLLQLTMAWIETNLRTLEYRKSMLG